MKQLNRLIVYKLTQTKLAAFRNIDSTRFACPLVYVLEIMKMQVLKVRKIQLAIRKGLFQLQYPQSRYTSFRLKSDKTPPTLRGIDSQSL